MNSFRANGKLLITAEYSVLRGALALALPTTFGQRLEISPTTHIGLIWKSFDHKNNLWFTAQFSSDLQLHSTSDQKTAEKLENLLKEAQKLNPTIDLNGVVVSTFLEFDAGWGLGSSSTLVALVAQWFQVDALALFFKSFTGSGYDVACALSDTPITYRLTGDVPQILETNFKPPFKDQIHFVYLGKKQRSDKEVARFDSLSVSEEVLDRITEITGKMTSCSNLKEFENLIDEHEQLTSKLINREPIKKQLFKDYNGAIKSLGAWGGDFIMVTNLDDQPHYFNDRGYDTILSWQEMIGM
jgi:mevalonate kinase